MRRSMPSDEARHLPFVTMQASAHPLTGTRQLTLCTSRWKCVMQTEAISWDTTCSEASIWKVNEAAYDAEKEHIYHQLVC